MQYAYMSIWFKTGLRRKKYYKGGEREVEEFPGDREEWEVGDFPSLLISYRTLAVPNAITT